MGKNDLWITATGIMSNATLVTTDGDFDRLDPLFLTVDQISPDHRPV